MDVSCVEDIVGILQPALHGSERGRSLHFTSQRQRSASRSASLVILDDGFH
jgi:hypothetical protein